MAETKAFWLELLRGASSIRNMPFQPKLNLFNPRISFDQLREYGTRSARLKMNWSLPNPYVLGCPSKVTIELDSWQEPRLIMVPGTPLCLSAQTRNDSSTSIVCWNIPQAGSGAALQVASTMLPRSIRTISQPSFTPDGCTYFLAATSVTHDEIELILKFNSQDYHEVEIGWSVTRNLPFPPISLAGIQLQWVAVNEEIVAWLFYSYDNRDWRVTARNRRSGKCVTIVSPNHSLESVFHTGGHGSYTPSADFAFHGRNLHFARWHRWHANAPRISRIPESVLPYHENSFEADSLIQFNLRDTQVECHWPVPVLEDFEVYKVNLSIDSATGIFTCSGQGRVNHVPRCITAFWTLAPKYGVEESVALLCTRTVTLPNNPSQFVLAFLGSGKVFLWTYAWSRKRLVAQSYLTMLQYQPGDESPSVHKLHLPLKPSPMRQQWSPDRCEPFGFDGARIMKTIVDDGQGTIFLTGTQVDPFANKTVTVFCFVYA